MTGRVRANGEGSIFPYRNGFAAYVWVTTPSGRRDRKYVYGKTREAVHEKWIKLQREAQQGPVATSVPTVGQYLNYWLDDVVKPNLAPLTYATYESHSRLYLIPGIGSKRINKLRGQDVQTLLNRIGATCQCCSQGRDAARPKSKQKCCALGRCCKRYLSAASLKGVQKTIRAALTQATIDELVARNVAEHVKLPSVRKKARKRQSWESDDAYQFLETARTSGDYLYAAYVLIVVMGLRKGEVLGLTWSDIDFANAELNISTQLQRVRGVLHHRETKTEESEAPLPLVDLCVSALKLRADEQKKHRKEAEIWHKTDLVFTTRFGRPIEPRNFNRSFDAAIKRADVKRITVHDARRTCGSLLADLDVHPRVAMQILRHAQFALTMEIYTQVSSKQTREALKLLEKALDRREPAGGTTASNAQTEGGEPAA